jgi:hypothetical protein
MDANGVTRAIELSHRGAQKGIPLNDNWTLSFGTGRAPSYLQNGASGK